MNRSLLTGTPLRMAAYAAVLAAAFGAAFAVGAAAEPVGARSVASAEDTHGNDSEHAGGVEGETAAAALPGLAGSDAGFRLVPGQRVLPLGAAVPFEFTVMAPDGRPLTTYETAHEKEMHLIVVRRDLSGFQHVHPSRAADGTWSVTLDVAAAGSYRAFADFAPDGFDESITLGTDLVVAGELAPVALPAPSTMAVVDGYEVALRGRPRPGGVSDLTFTVRQDGRDVTSLEPYLGSFGHLVSLRVGDLAYLHTHPVTEAHDEGPGGPEVRFGAEFPTSGSYRLFLDFQVGGTVRTAEFTVEIP